MSVPGPTATAAEVVASVIDLRVLSIRPVWADGILRGYKMHEYRSWKPPKWPLWFILHASKNDTRGDVLRAVETYGEQAARPERARAALLGLCYVDDVEKKGEHIAWHIARVLPFPEPIASAGKLSLWRLSYAQHLAVRAAVGLPT